MVLQLLAEAIRQPRQPPHVHSHAQVASHNWACGYVRRIGPSMNRRLRRADDVWRAIPTRSDRLGFVAFYHLPEVHVTLECPPRSIHVSGERVCGKLTPVNEPRGEIV